MSGFIIQFSETHEPLSRDVSCDGVTRNRVRLREIKLISHPAEARLRNLYGSIERSAVPRLAIEQFDRSLDVYREYLEPPQRHERGLHNAVSKKRSHIFTSIARIPIDPYPYPSAASSPPPTPVRTRRSALRKCRSGESRYRSAPISVNGITRMNERNNEDRRCTLRSITLKLISMLISRSSIGIGNPQTVRDTLNS